MKKAVLKYGIISGMVSAIMVLITGFIIKKTGFNYTEYIGYTAMIVSFLFILPGMVYYRDNANHGHISFGRALAIGLLITAVSGIFYVIAWNIVYHTMMPDFWDRYGAYTASKMKANGASQTDIDTQLKSIQQYKNIYKSPIAICLLTFMEPAPVGILMSFIFAFIVRLKK